MALFPTLRDFGHTLDGRYVNPILLLVRAALTFCSTILTAPLKECPPAMCRWIAGFYKQHWLESMREDTVPEVLRCVWG